jgi:hypothetical protein
LASASVTDAEHPSDLRLRVLVLSTLLKTVWTAGWGGRPPSNITRERQKLRSKAVDRDRLK